MSYDITIVDKETKMPLHTELPHQIYGGTYCVNGLDELWLNVTYNYAPFFRNIFKRYGDNGIHCLEGKPVEETLPWIREAIEQLGDDYSDNYWEPTEGNAKRALSRLLQLAELGKDGEWEIT